MDGGAPIGDTSAACAGLQSTSGGTPSSSGGFGSGGDPSSSGPHGGGRWRVPEAPEESHQSWVESTSCVAPLEDM